MAKKALLTIDDGPSTLTKDLVGFLKGEGVPAVLFFQGSHLETHPEAALAALEAGMTVGNHAYSHRGFSSLNPAEAEHEIGRTEELLDALHQRAGVRRSLRLFRFPYGDKGGPHQATFAAWLRRGFDVLDTSGVTYPWFEPVRDDPDVFWTFDTGDYKLANPDYHTSWAALVAHLDEPRPAQGGSLVEGDSDEIVLLHDHPHTQALQPGYYRDLVLGIRDRGLVFVPPVKR